MKHLFLSLKLLCINLRPCAHTPSCSQFPLLAEMTIRSNFCRFESGNLPSYRLGHRHKIKVCVEQRRDCETSLNVERLTKDKTNLILLLRTHAVSIHEFCSDHLSRLVTADTSDKCDLSSAGSERPLGVGKRSPMEPPSCPHTPSSCLKTDNTTGDLTLKISRQVALLCWQEEIRSVLEVQRCESLWILSELFEYDKIQKSSVVYESSTAQSTRGDKQRKRKSSAGVCAYGAEVICMAWAPCWKAAILPLEISSSSLLTTGSEH
ncbi:hypothetical protein RRG08_056639 [Elysia crispata]|uniref:Uncharacterized protein n=1 Tax=Elysia crispata TaxID=231223 RepID=A0AAE0XZZ2_9GAST|nr:hypothetical protein RRG08_056639 [Elysia crispata]